MICSNCSEKNIQLEIERIQGTGNAYQKCPECEGVFLSMQTLKVMERLGGAIESCPDEGVQISPMPENFNCPKCRTSIMKHVKDNQAEGFGMLYCDKCANLWLDSERLLATRIAFEESPAGQDILARKHAMLNMSEERKAQLEENIAKAPDDKAAAEAKSDFIDEVLGAGMPTEVGVGLSLIKIIRNLFR